MFLLTKFYVKSEHIANLQMSNFLTFSLANRIYFCYSD